MFRISLRVGLALPFFLFLWSFIDHGYYKNPVILLSVGLCMSFSVCLCAVTSWRVIPKLDDLSKMLEKLDKIEERRRELYSPRSSVPSVHMSEEKKSEEKKGKKYEKL